MSKAVELVVSLKIPDVTALTARRALRRRMGYADTLADLRRADWWRLTLDVPDDDAALALGRRLAEQTNCFVNPNKHVYACTLKAAAAAPALEGVTTVGVLTGFDDEARAGLVTAELRGRLGYPQVLAVEHGTLWTLGLTTPDPAAARALAERLTVADSRRGGLLVNPHSMWWRLL